jgi:hypothetical protein
MTVIDPRNEARLALGSGQEMTTRIISAIEDIVVTNAPAIADFLKRREELTRTDPEYLFFYCVSFVMYARSRAGRWQASEIAAVLESVATEFVRSVRYHIQTERDAGTQIGLTAASIQSMFHSVSANLEKLMASGDPKKASFTLFLMYLRKVYPAWDTIFAEGHTIIGSEVIRAFGQISMSAFGLGECDIGPPLM